MTPESTARSKRVWEITIDSDWTMTVGLAVLFIVCASLLAREIRHFLLGIGDPPHLNGALFTRIFTALAVVYCFRFAFRWPTKFVRVAWMIVGAVLTVDLVSGYAHPSSAIRHLVAVGASAVSQVALVIFLVAIVQWFKSVIRWGSPSEPGGGNR